MGFCHYSITLPVILRWAPLSDSRWTGSIKQWEERSLKGRNRKGHGWRCLTNGCKKKKKKILVTARKEGEPVSWPLCQSCRALRSSYSLARTPHRSLCQSVTCLVTLSAALSCAPSAWQSVAPLVCRSVGQWITRPFSSCYVTVPKLTGFCPPINHRRSSISRCDIQKKKTISWRGGRHQKGRANSSAISVCFGTKHRNRRYQVADGHGTANKNWQWLVW